MPKVNPHADPTRRDLGPAALGRTVKKLFSYYPVLAPVTFVCILFSSIVSSVPSLFTQNIIQIIEKWYVSRDWAAAKAEIVPYLTLLVVLYALSILSMTVYTQLMAYMTQGFLHKLRCEMFGGMQKLPIRYFDSHQHGDIMSHYTNDIDTLRQLVSQALPALIQSGAIVLVVFSIMLYFSLWLTLVLVLGIIAMVAVTKKIGGGSAKYFVRQQKAVASTEGFIQEMMAGQKVVKVFCHEQKSIEDFDRLNDALFEDSFRAQAYASVLGPIIGNIGNILYVTLALVGGVFLLIGLPNVSLSGKALDISILVPGRGSTRTATAPSPTPPCAATCASPMWTSPTPRARTCCTTYPFTPSRARRSPLSARPARAKRPSRTSSTAFTTLPTARSATTASTSTRSRRRICAAPSVLFCRRRTSSPAR